MLAVVSCELTTPCSVAGRLTHWDKHPHLQKVNIAEPHGCVVLLVQNTCQRAVFMKAMEKI